MFVCRACRSQQQRWFSSATSRPAAYPGANTQSSPTETLYSNMRQSTSRRPPNALSGRFRANSALPAELRTQPAKPVSAADAQRKALQEQQKRDWADMERQMSRTWTTGDVYAPHDLSPAEMRKWKTMKPRGKQAKDVCDVLNLNPLEHYKNFSVMSEFVTETGQIKGRADTGLRPVNQRRMAKAIRRAVACGLMSSVYRHPELLRLQYTMQEKSSTSSMFGKLKRG